MNLSTEHLTKTLISLLLLPAKVMYSLGFVCCLTVLLLVNGVTQKIMNGLFQIFQSVHICLK